MLETPTTTWPAIGRRPLLGLLALVTISAVVVVVLPGEAAHAKRLVGTKAADRLIGTGKADRIKGGAGDARIKGRKGADRLLGGKGADRIKAADGEEDRAVRGGPGKDACSVDASDQSHVKGCEKVKVKGAGAAGCVAPPPDRAIGASDAPGSTTATAPRGDPPLTFSEAFYNTTITLNASSDGAVEDQLPISIEEACDVPAALQAEAAQLIGIDAVAIIGPATTVFQNGVQLEGDEVTMALADLDAVEVKARLLRPEEWVQDEDGNPVPTFDAIQITIVD
jgi:RTX calcium-binding nonapeptide repeat (4 copies)